MYDTRLTKKGRMRRRRCKGGHRFTTYEVLASQVKLFVPGQGPIEADEGVLPPKPPRSKGEIDPYRAPVKQARSSWE